MLDKTYDAKSVEQRLYDAWDRSDTFAIGSRGNAEPYTIVIPPPNVTGSLHMGHALNNTLQDILIRHERMRGRDALWQPGTDHAGIATQMVVERQLEDKGKSRREIGRDAFVDQVWAWKSESGGLISRQLRRLGASADWSRERFTMDEGLSRAVTKVFVDLYREGLIYKDTRLVNWDPKLHTAISDLEVQQQEVESHLWHFRYPIEGDEKRFVTVATTRPETMLGDTAVAVHPDDERYRDLVGRNAILPLVGRRLPIVADSYADPEQGSGAVKITPAHDFNDYEVGRRHDLEMINIFTRDAHLNENVPAEYRGLERFAARKRILAELDARGLLEKTETHVHSVPYGDRGGVPVEPYLTEQWYVDAARLAGPAIRAVEEGRTRFVPENWSKTYFEWMRNIQPWCISRQLWWGHRIPAWYGPDGEIFVGHDEAEAQSAARRHYGASVDLEQDPDVLDTWFSSGLWPFSTLGWPDQTPELQRYYPTDVLVTGFDIIFFWVARMMMLGLHFLDEVPFHTVYIHALVRDEKGQKMSKSKGNIIDPLEMINEYSADALRFTLCSMAAQGRDIKLSKQRVEGNRNFTTKLWNAARYCEMNDCRHDSAFDPGVCEEIVNRWIVGEIANLRIQVDDALAGYRFNEAAMSIYQSIWNVFCDWYLEFSKPLLADTESAAARETRATMSWCLDQLLILLHPIMPFVTEELWGRRDNRRASPLITASWPSYGTELVDSNASDEMNWVIRLVTLVRNIRAELNVPPRARIRASLTDADAEIAARLERHRTLIVKLAGLAEINLAESVPENAIEAILGEANLVLELAEFIDINAETTRLRKELTRTEQEIDGYDRKLANEKFLARAPVEVVETQRERRASALETRERLGEALRRLQR